MKFRRKRELAIQLRKVKPEPAQPQTLEETERVATITEKAVKLAFKTVLLGAGCVYGYVLVDTFRQVKIAEANNIYPE